MIAALVVALALSGPAAPRMPEASEGRTSLMASPPLDPARPCTATQPCLTPQYCPDTGGFIVGYQMCPSLYNGPYSPGGLRPNE